MYKCIKFDQINFGYPLLTIALIIISLFVCIGISLNKTQIIMYYSLTRMKVLISALFSFCFYYVLSYYINSVYIIVSSVLIFIALTLSLKKRIIIFDKFDIGDL
jgi:hypothetical protein